MSKLKVGDQVMWKGAFGHAPAVKAKVLNIEKNCKAKHGESVDEINWSEVNSREVVVDLDTNCWAYGTQIKPIR